MKNVDHSLQLCDEGLYSWHTGDGCPGIRKKFNSFERDFKIDFEKVITQFQ